MGYRVTSEADDIVIRLPRGETDERTLNELLSYLELQELLRRSQLSEADAAQLSRDIKQGAWEQVKELFTGD